MTYRTINSCRICNGRLSNHKLNLGYTPIANELYNSSNTAKLAETFPLVVVMCENCLHFQLDTLISMDRLYSNYVYSTGISISFQKHFEELATRINNLVPDGGKVLEVGSNDGTLLSKLKALKVNSMGIEPSKNLVSNCERKGLKTIEGFIDRDWKLILQNFGKFDLIVGNNVFAHIENLSGAFTAVSELLNESGIFIFEVAHFKNLVSESLFDTIYHEHMSYHTVTSLEKILPMFNLYLYDVEKIKTHGGSIRVYASKEIREKSQNVNEIINEENDLGVNTVGALEILERKIQTLKKEATTFVIRNRADLIGYAAPAKAVTFLSLVPELASRISIIVDDNPLKQGKYLPKTGIPIVSSMEFSKVILGSESNFIIVNFAWNLAMEINNQIVRTVKKSISVVNFLPKISIKENNETYD